MPKFFSITLIAASIFCGSFIVSSFVLPANQISVENETAHIASVGNVIYEPIQENNRNSFPEKSLYLKNFLADQKQNFISSRTSFFEINLQEMKARIYQKGILEKEIPILAKGDPDCWAGVPVGSYEALSGNKNAFSNVANVYMPWSINFYGKYYIHGEPYYPNGEKSNFNYTGGCVRFSDQNAEFIYNAAEIGMPILIIDKPTEDGLPLAYGSPSSVIPEISAESMLVADLDNNYILAEKNYQKSLPVASLTKLMTAIVVVENNDLRKSILVKPEMLLVYGSTKDLVVDKRYNLVELLHPLLIESSNDAAESLSAFLGKEKTIKLMNEKAKSIGMENTIFIEPTGLSKENISTAQDLFYLSRYILNTRPPLLRITKGETITDFGTMRFKDLDNKNIFSENQDFLGGKTGFILASQYTGMFIFHLPLSNNDSRNISITLLGSDNLENDVNKILTWWFNQIYLLQL